MISPADRPNLFARALTLAEGGSSTQQVIKQLKAERYDDVERYLSPSFRRQLARARRVSMATPRD